MEGILLIGLFFGFMVLLAIAAVIIAGITLWKSKKKGVKISDGIDKDEFAIIKDSFDEAVDIEESLAKLVKIQQAINSAIAKKQEQKSKL